MLPLPILNVRLQPCHEDWQLMTPTAQGRHCAQCNRTVLDFRHASQADLDTARTTSPDGRVCGRFLTGQLAPPPLLWPKLRRFLVALVLVCGLGLSGREAVAQIMARTPTVPSEVVSISQLSAAALELEPLPLKVSEPEFMGIVVEQMPKFKGGQAALEAYIKRNLRYPKGATQTGKVFVTFIITNTGRVKQASIRKGLEPLLNNEVLRVIRRMPAWQPGSQLGRPIDVRYTLPITFVRP